MVDLAIDLAGELAPGEGGPELDQVTNDAQLKRAAGDFATFAGKSSPAGDDVFLIEDSAASGAKKKTTFIQLVAQIASVGDGAPWANDVEGVESDLAAHVGDVANPHAVTPAQIGAATTAALAAHVANVSNPHALTKSQIGLANVSNDAQLALAGGTLTGPVKTTPFAVAFGATPTFDLAAHDDFALGVVTSDFAITFSNPAVGQSGEVAMVQDATGGRKITGITVAGFTVKVEGASAFVNSAEFKVPSSNSLLVYRLCLINAVPICFIGVIPSATPSYA